MRTHVALLRGVNVGGNNKVPMKDLRALVSSLGYGEVETYIQSGNIVFSADGADPDRIRVALEESIAREMGVGCDVVVVSRAEMAEVIDGNPYPHEADHKRLHTVFRTTPYGPPDLESVEEAVNRARAKGSRDEVSVAGRIMYLWTPDGFGRSELAAQLSRRAMKGGTARNWATVRKLAELLGS